MKAWKVIVILAALAACSHGAKADGSPIVASYDISGTVSVIGNNACGGPCIETVGYSFVVDYYATATGYSLEGAGPGEITGAIGPLGTFTNNGCCTSLANYGYIDLPSSTGDDIEIVFNDVTLGYSEPTIQPVTALGGKFWECISQTCRTDFSPIGQLEFDDGLGFTVNSTAMLVPEPGTLSLLGIGMFGFFGFVLLLKWRLFGPGVRLQPRYLDRCV